MEAVTPLHMGTLLGDGKSPLEGLFYWVKYWGKFFPEQKPNSGRAVAGWKNGTAGQARTDDLRIHNPAL